MSERSDSLPPLVYEALRTLLQPQGWDLILEMKSAGKAGAIPQPSQARLIDSFERSGLIRAADRERYCLTFFGSTLLNDLTKQASRWEEKAHSALAAATEWGQISEMSEIRPPTPPPDLGLEWGHMELADLVDEEHLIDFEDLTGSELALDVDFGPVVEPLYEVIWGAVIQAAQRGEEAPVLKPRQPIPLDLRTTPQAVLGDLALSTSVVTKATAHLRAGRNLLLVGPRSCGKTTLAHQLATALCGKENFTQVEAQNHWTASDLLGWLEQDEDGHATFKEGLAARAARKCEASVTRKRQPRPHYLIIDNFERADMDLAFGKLFTVFEYRELLPLLTTQEARGRPYLMPPEFRLIATYDTATTQGQENLQMGFALRRRFAFVEVTIPSTKQEERVLRSQAPKLDLTILTNLLKFTRTVRDHYPLGTGYLVEALSANGDVEDIEKSILQSWEGIWPLLSRPALREVSSSARVIWGQESELARNLEARAEGSVDIFEALSQV